MAIALGEWVELLGKEYLAEFVASGGASVKLAVVPPDQAACTLGAVARLGTELGYAVAPVDAAETRVHMIDRVFYAVARQIEWDTLSERYLRRLMVENGIRVERDRPLREIDAIAEANGRDRSDLFGELHRLIDHHLLQNYALSREFRQAMALLCWGQLNPQNVSPSDVEIIHRWLIGEKWSLAALKRLQIYQRIARHNARHMLASLARWLHEAGHAGLILLLDLNAVVTDDPPAIGGLRYTRNAILDTYEVLRQFIDETDEMAHLMVIGVAGPGLVEDPRRSVDNYTALKLRTSDEVRDRSRANPLNTMVRLDVGRE